MDIKLGGSSSSSDFGFLQCQDLLLQFIIIIFLISFITAFAMFCSVFVSECPRSCREMLPLRNILQMKA